jgi:hypothetical protein
MRRVLISEWSHPLEHHALGLSVTENREYVRCLAHDLGVHVLEQHPMDPIALHRIRPPWIRTVEDLTEACAEPGTG